MLTTSENMVAEPQGELQALLADYESYVGNGVLAPVGAEPLDGAIANELPAIDDSDIMTFPDDSMVVVAPEPPAPSVEPATPAPANPLPADPPPMDPPPMDPPVVSGPAMDDPTQVDPGATPPDATPADGAVDPTPSSDPVIATLGEVVEGGAGQNVFEVHGLSPRFEDLGRITDFTQGEDLLRFDGAITATPENVAMFTAESYADARLAAVRLIEGGQADYVAVQIADDVVVFGDNGNDVVDAAVVLTGRRLTDVGMHDFG